MTVVGASDGGDSFGVKVRLRWWSVLGSLIAPGKIGGYEVSYIECVPLRGVQWGILSTDDLVQVAVRSWGGFGTKAAAAHRMEKRNENGVWGLLQELMWCLIGSHPCGVCVICRDGDVWGWRAGSQIVVLPILPTMHFIAI